MTHELSQAVAQTSRITFWGKVSATFFILASLAVVDGLQALARHDFNSFDLIPGETTFISGMLPEGVTTHENLEIRVEGVRGITVRPVASFKGFWLGGQMWRAEVNVPEFAHAGQASLTVVDLIRPTRKISQGESQEQRNTAPEAGVASKGIPQHANEAIDLGSALSGKQTDGQVGETSLDEADQPILPLVQNPMLVYDVTIWDNALERQRAEKSFVRKISGYSSFWLAGLAVVVALLAGVKGWYTFATAEKELSAKGLYIVHGVKKPGSPSPSGYETEGWQALCAYYGDTQLHVGDSVLLYDKEAQACGEGIVREMRAESFMATFPANGVAPVYSWIIGKPALTADDA